MVSSAYPKCHCKNYLLLCKNKVLWWCVLDDKVILCSPFKSWYKLSLASVVTFHLLSPLGLSSQTSDSSTFLCLLDLYLALPLTHRTTLGLRLGVLHLPQFYLKSSGLLPKVGNWFMEALGSCLGCSLRFLENIGCMPECSLQNEWDDAVRSRLHNCFSLYSMHLRAYVCACMYIRNVCIII